MKPRCGRNVCSPLLGDVKALAVCAVAEERGHRDTAVLLDLGVAEVAGGLVFAERPDDHVPLG